MSPTQSEAEANCSTYFDFRVYDSSDAEQFNTDLGASVWYYPASTTDAQIRSIFNYTDSETWQGPRVEDDYFEVYNEVSDVGYNAEPGAFNISVPCSKKVVIVWYVLAAPDARPLRYRRLFRIYDQEGENKELWFDRFRAGL